MIIEILYKIKKLFSKESGFFEVRYCKNKIDMLKENNKNIAKFHYHNMNSV